MDYYLQLFGTCLISVAATAFLMKRPATVVAVKPLTNLPPTTSRLKMVLLVRTDLPMSPGKAAAQCCHACLEAYKKGIKVCPKWIEKWDENGMPKITLKVNSEEDLLNLERKAKEVGLVANSILDAGRTQLESGTRTCCAIGPGPVELVDKVTGGLKLY